MNTIYFLATYIWRRPDYRRFSVRCVIIVAGLFLYPCATWAVVTCQDGKVTVSGTVTGTVKPNYNCSGTGVTSVIIAQNAKIVVKNGNKAIILAHGAKLTISQNAHVESKGSYHTTYGNDGLMLKGGSEVNIDGTVFSNDTEKSKKNQKISEAIVIAANGNTITVGEHGLLKTLRGDVLFFQSRSSGQNTLKNYGMIQAGADGKGTFANIYSHQGLKFNVTNGAGGTVNGNLYLGNNSDTIILEQGSVFNGKINTRGGADQITIENGATFTSIDAGNEKNNKDILNLMGDDTAGASLSGTVKNIDSLNKQGSGKWLIDDKLSLSPSAQVKVEEGTLAFENLQTYQGATKVSGGILQAAAKNVFSAQSAHTVASGATVDLHGFDQTVQSVSNQGTIALGSAGKPATLTVTGDYQGDGGRLQFYTVLGDDGSSSDKMIVTGDVSGTTAIEVMNDSGLGAQTTGNGIPVVEVGGTSTEDAFSLRGNHVDAGAYQYYLYQGETNSTTATDNNWYLRSSKKPIPQKKGIPQKTGTSQKKGTSQKEEILTYRQEVPIYAGLPAQLRQASLSLIGNLQQRIGEAPTGQDRQLWIRSIRKNITIDQNGVAEVSSKGHFSGFQIGSDFWSRNNWSVGGYVGYLRSKIKFSGFAGGENVRVGIATTHSYSLGAYTTHTWTDASYLDLVVQGTQHNADLRTNEGQGSAQHGNKDLTLSVEAGKSFALGSSHWSVVPQVQAVQQWLHMRDAHLSGATTVRHKHTNSALFRLGVSAQGKYTLGKHRFNPYARANLYYSPSGADHVSFTTRTTNTTLTSGVRHYDKEVALGMSLDLMKNVTAYGEIGRIWSGGQAQIKPAGGVFLGIRAEW